MAEREASGDPSAPSRLVDVHGREGQSREGRAENDEAQGCWRRGRTRCFQSWEKMAELAGRDTSILELLEKKVADELRGKPSEEQERLPIAYTHWRIPSSAQKWLLRSEPAEKLGALIDGKGSK